MFDIRKSDAGADDSIGEAPALPLERLETQICELAGHITAATCRFLVLLGDFDARRGWASWDMASCASWLSWKCQMTSGTAREHVRVARTLRHLPVIRGQFAAGLLSYAKVRALTRIATPENEEGLAEIAGPMTGNQLERFARAHRQVSPADDDQIRIRQRLTWRVEETSSSLADALLVVAEAFLAEKVAATDNPDVYQVIVHVGTDALPAGESAGVSAETPTTVPGHPAEPARRHVEDGSAISVTTAQMITCTAALSWMIHDYDGSVLDVGRRRRKPGAALRRATRERDKCHCRFPGCDPAASTCITSSTGSTAAGPA